ncbi:MAG: hypothetical protein SWE60_05125 [Thermodesulfobacteriota bacterium]|nr:hypothetical protein [Thermodesulfobacteriota bacterium]
MVRDKPVFEYAIICDDIRHEMGDKFSLIGIYGSDIYVAQIPFLFPKLCVVVAYRHMQSGDSFSIDLHDPSGQPLGQTVRGTVPKEVESSSRFMIFNVFPPLQVHDPGQYKLVIVINGDVESQKEVPFVIRSGESRVVH